MTGSAERTPDFTKIATGMRRKPVCTGALAVAMASIPCSTFYRCWCPGMTLVIPPPRSKRNSARYGFILQRRMITAPASSRWPSTSRPQLARSAGAPRWSSRLVAGSPRDAPNTSSHLARGFTVMRKWIPSRASAEGGHDWSWRYKIPATFIASTTRCLRPHSLQKRRTAVCQ
jgi:hypothetical protein